MALEGSAITDCIDGVEVWCSAPLDNPAYLMTEGRDTPTGVTSFTLALLLGGWHSSKLSLKEEKI